MKTLNMRPAEPIVSRPEGSLLDHVAEHPRVALAMTRDPGKLTARAAKTLPGLPAPAKSQCPRVAIKVGGKILFINLGEVISIQANGKYVWLRRNASSYLLRESISVVAERLEPHGFIRIHRSMLVNTSCVEEIRPLSTGEYCLRVEDGKEYTVTRRYKKNLKSLAEFWIGTGTSLSG